MNIISNQLNKSVVSPNILDIEYDEFVSIIDLSLDLLLGEY